MQRLSPRQNQLNLGLFSLNQRSVTFLGAILIATLAAITACWASDDYKSTIPPLFMGGEQAQSDLQTTGGSQLFVPSNTPLETKELTLDLAISRALAADPHIQAGYENIRQSEADLVTAGLLPNPELTTDYLMAPWGKPFVPTKQGGPSQTDALVFFPIDWLLFGKRASEIVSAQRGVDVSTAQFADMVRLRIAETISAFYDVLEAQAMVELARIDIESLTQVENITSQRVELGGAGSIELDRVRVSIFSGRRELRSREAELYGAMARLRSFLGLSKELEFQVKGSLDVTKPVDLIDSEKAFDLAEQNRPDLVALHHALDLASQNITVEERRAYPEVKPGFGYTKQFQGEVEQPNAQSWNVILEMSMPIFNRNQGNIDKAKSLRVQAEHNLGLQLVNLRAEIAQAVKNFKAARDALLIDDPGQLESARNVRDKIRAAYELGGKPLIDVLDSQRGYQETYRLHIVSRSSYWHSLFALNAAIGTQALK
ncbi:MAG: hypothetical protein RLZZ627_204 [Pseudomonadota bacterium]|jgi:cobalt-zinc-cadmium efflux system outer membrane protein